MAHVMVGLDFVLGPSFEIVIVDDSDADDTKEMLKALRNHFVPNKVILFKPSEENDPNIVQYATFIKSHKSIGNKVTAYICLNYSCKIQQLI